MLKRAVRLWRDGDKWHFQQAGAACKVHVVVPHKVAPQTHAAWAEAQLCKAVRAEHARAAKRVKAQTLRQAEQQQNQLNMMSSGQVS